ncbi:hypothetical protein [Riemerella columbina]|uniref:hypothetical protein n=1 Tax=Riemerella columbina TaxID=103810 RepID=UPI00266F3F4C|nr:hypothetical protein [Riemerella columbina]WKS94977.1 hypothetical protein NYR17_08620 [Riemerella columbina]
MNYRKSTYITLILFICNALFIKAQVIIGDPNKVAYENDTESVLLQFSTSENRGLILPYVREYPSNITEGTILLDARDPQGARVRYYNGEWIDLSQQSADITSALQNQPELGVGDADKAKVIIGNATTSADGVLVLESQTQAMVLPMVNDYKDIINPSPGMMVFINKAGSKRLAVFNGSKWSFWKGKD